MSKKQKKVESGRSLVAPPLSPANTFAQPPYPPPPGYRVVYYCTKEPGTEMALFNAVPARVYRDLLAEALAYEVEQPQITTNSANSDIADLPISA